MAETRLLNHRFFCVFVILYFAVVFTAGKNLNRNLHRNFVSVKFTNETVRELRVAFRGFLMMETSAFQNSEFELHLKEITDGRRLIKSVYQNGVLKDCDFETKSDIILNYVEKFASIFERNPRKNNGGDVFEVYQKIHGTPNDEAFRYFRHRKFLKKLKKLINIKHDLRACHRLIRMIRKQHIHERSTNMKNEMKSFSDILRKLKAKFRTELQQGSNTTNSDKPQTDETPDQSNSKMAKIQLKNRTKMNGGKANSRKLARSKRSSLFNRFLMYPGTKWCGRGQTALHFNDLGTDKEADVCCRDHDLCPHIIESFEYKYGVFNYRIHALLHCKCDRRFRECLQQSVSPTAPFLGDIYFNMMGTKCFEFEYEKVCTSRSWWGSCLKKEKRRMAHIKEQKPFDYN